MESFISIKSLNKSYKEGSTTHHVLKELDWQIEEGKIAVMFGRSGSGKSTILNLLSGIDLPETGSISVNGIDITKLNENDRTIFRRERVGFIFQFFNLIPTLTVMENLLMPLELNKMNDKKHIQNAEELLDLVGLANRQNSYPDMLSGGEQQRVAIARSLVHEPDILLADEPTGNLDFETGTKVIDILDKLVREKKKTMVMATHSKDVIGLADNIFFLRKGVVKEITAEEL